MAEVLTITVPSSAELKEGGKSFTSYTVACKYGEVSWSTSKRYSQFLELKTKMDKDLVRISAPFPKKSFGSLSAAALEKRREQLDAYMVELCGAFLPEHLHDYLSMFVDMKANIAKAASEGGGQTEVVDTPALAPESSPAAEADAESPCAGGGGGASWDASFMNEDPLAGLLAPEPKPEPEASPAPKPKSTPKPPAPPPSAAAASSPAAAGSAPLPGFFSSSGAKTYPATGEGLRDAIKDKNIAGVKQVLEQQPESANYRDRLSQSMLHLAAIFDNSEVAELLLAAGADPLVKNSDGETAMDVAQPTLKLKIQAAVEKK